MSAAGNLIEGVGWIPAACSLPTVEQPLGLREFDKPFAQTVVGFRGRRPTG